MNENTIEGSIKSGAGGLQKAAGEALDDPRMQAGGAGRRLEGQAQNAVGQAQGAIGEAVGQVRSAASQVAGKAQDAYAQAQDRVQAVRDQVDPFVQERPYAALGLAAAAGLFAGLLLASRGPKVVVVRPRV